jgi:hypothetical protein
MQFILPLAAALVYVAAALFLKRATETGANVWRATSSRPFSSSRFGCWAETFSSSYQWSRLNLLFLSCLPSTQTHLQEALLRRNIRRPMRGLPTLY